MKKFFYHEFWCVLLFPILSHSAMAASDLYVGFVSQSPTVFRQVSIEAVLKDELDILYGNASVPVLLHFNTPELALNALKNHQIDLLISASPPSSNLINSEPLLTLDLAYLKRSNSRGETICFPNIPVDVKPQCTLFGSTQFDENVLRVIKGEASKFIGPEFLIRIWLENTPVTTLSMTTSNISSKMRYYAWALPSGLNNIKKINNKIRHLNKGSAHWLEQKWLLPSGSFYNIISPSLNKYTQRLPIEVILPTAPAPFVQLTEDGEIQGVWHDLLMTLLPKNHYVLTFRLESNSQPELSDYKQAHILIAADTQAPTPDSIPFDSTNWVIASSSSKPLTGDPSTWENKRIAVNRHTEIASIIGKMLPSKNIVLYDDIAQGIELVEAGGADGLIGYAYPLSFALRQHYNQTLQLSPLAIPGSTFWFVTSFTNQEDEAQVRALLSSVTPGEIYNHRAFYEGAVKEVDSFTGNTLWLIIMGIGTLLSTLTAIIIFNLSQLQRRRHRRDNILLHNTLSLWQTLMNNAPVPLFTCDAAGRLTRYNSAFEQSALLASTPQLGSHGADLPLGEIAQYLSLPQRLTILNSTNPVTGESILHDNSITIYWWLCRYLSNSGKPRGIVGGWIDISEKAALTHALNEALEQAERASTEKSIFLARMSHEIRTPLNAVLGLLEIEKEKSDYLSIAWQAAETLRDLIGEILDLSRIEAGELKLEYSPHRLDEVLMTNINIYSTSAKSKGLSWECKLEIPSNTYFLFDKIRFNQIIANLLGNAIKYTSNGTIFFNASFRGQYLQINIDDTGIGINHDAMRSIGQPWFKADHNSAHSSGLGLAICYQLVELMAGTLDIKSKVGLGTQVCLTLPFETSLLTEASNPENENTLITLPPQLIIVVDDFPANLTVMSLQLEHLGQQVICCENAKEALLIMAEHRVDVLITDCQMPGMDGYHLVKILLLQNLLGLANAPEVIMGCTANSLLAEEELARHAGMDYLLRKPLSEKRLEKILSQQFSLVNTQPDLSEIFRLSNGRPEILELMYQQLCDAIKNDIHFLKKDALSVDELSRIGHRLKSSFSLFNMREAVRGCQVLENIHELLSSGELEHGAIESVVNSFINLMQNNLVELDNVIKNLSDKY